MKIKCDGYDVEVKSEQCVSANLLTVTAGTNCPQGCDAGHGGRTYLALTNDGGTCISVIVNGQRIDDADKIELIFAGDCERDTLVQALEFAIDQIKGDDSCILSKTQNRRKSEKRDTFAEDFGRGAK
jgi:hypothetical protein